MRLLCETWKNLWADSQAFRDAVTDGAPAIQQKNSQQGIANNHLKEPSDGYWLFLVRYSSVVLDSKEKPLRIPERAFCLSCQ